ncbi:hydantoinase/oxoprolinase N-terminal domain-containing protein [Algirhabdus cladophorae]|uniref:hydantoinase/oxoprolinase N-terminal domain-containing protein n=1 Tax=Algirhabdus cladophorae TaxID=3377108 RepID=UPI003B847FA5
MALLLGVDTGGTYTDAVLIKDETDVLASAKSLTTRHDLAIGISRAIQAVLVQSNADPRDISMASLSTTLATNALVEGQGERVALIFVGFAAQDLDKHGLTEALKGDPVLVMEGGHTHSGAESKPLDITVLDAFLDQYGAEVSGFAVASQFATRNPAHEHQISTHIAKRTGLPVSASHQLSAKLNGPKRAMTALLNARLIGMIDRLISKAEATLRDHKIQAPLMVVRGDGALISSAQARLHPIETILSGPAASIVGASWMTGQSQAMVSDIGGTTTDIAILRDGQPAIDPAGAQVGPYRTMVEAVAMRTSGLGGDSQVHFVSEGLSGGVTLGPRRVLPVSLIAHEAPDVVLPALENQLRAAAPGEQDTRFVRAIAGQNTEGLIERDRTLLDRIGQDVHPVGKILNSRMDNGALNRLLDRGLVQVSGVTPSDASHVLGTLDAWSRPAALMALELIGRRRTGSGEMLAPEPVEMAQIIIDQLTHQTGLAVLEAAFAEEDPTFDQDPRTLANHVLVQRGLGHHSGLMRLDVGVNVPVIGLGASAQTYYPAVGTRLNCPMILPDHAGVANAIGAVVGQVTMRKSGTVTSPSDGKFRVHLSEGPQDFGSKDPALKFLEERLTQEATLAAQAAGAEDLQLSVERDVRKAKAEAREVFVEATITVSARGRPRVARQDVTS